MKDTKWMLGLSFVVFSVGMLLSYTLVQFTTPHPQYETSLALLFVNIKVYVIGIIIMVVALYVFDKVFSESLNNIFPVWVGFLTYGLFALFGVLMIALQPFDTETNVTSVVAGQILVDSVIGMLHLIRYSIILLYGALGIVRLYFNKYLNKSLD
jgi:hypothetical protein